MTLARRIARKAYKLTLGAVRNTVKARLGASKPGRYDLPGAYVHQEDFSHFDDTQTVIDYQVEVYRRAKEIAEERGYRRIFDFGCGAGTKLMRYFGEFDTVGFDVEPALSANAAKWPERKWAHAIDQAKDFGTADLVICADVIEHVPDPVQLLETIRSLSTGHIVLSTPDRNVLYTVGDSGRLGPPVNPSHIREWSFPEFERFVSRYLKVDEHVVSNREQATQMIVARP